MNHRQYLSHQTLTTAGTLTRLGCQVLEATAINGRSWVKARLPQRITPTARIQILAAAWAAPAIVEWRNA